MNEFKMQFHSVKSFVLKFNFRKSFAYLFSHFLLVREEYQWFAELLD